MMKLNELLNTSLLYYEPIKLEGLPNVIDDLINIAKNIRNCYRKKYYVIERK